MTLCDNCNAACCRVFEWAEVARVDPERLEWLRARGAVFKGKYVAVLRRCPQLNESNRCSIYARRPAMCRAFEPGSKACEANRRIAKTL